MIVLMDSWRKVTKILRLFDNNAYSESAMKIFVVDCILVLIHSVHVILISGLVSNIKPTL